MDSAVYQGKTVSSMLADIVSVFPQLGLWALSVSFVGFQAFLIDEWNDFQNFQCLFELAQKLKNKKI